MPETLVMRRLGFSWPGQSREVGRPKYVCEPKLKTSKLKTKGNLRDAIPSLLFYPFNPLLSFLWLSYHQSSMNAELDRSTKHQFDEMDSKAWNSLQVVRHWSGRSQRCRRTSFAQGPGHRSVGIWWDSGELVGQSPWFWIDCSWLVCFNCFNSACDCPDCRNNCTTSSGDVRWCLENDFGKYR